MIWLHNSLCHHELMCHCHLSYMCVSVLWNINSWNQAKMKVKCLIFIAAWYQCEIILFTVGDVGNYHIVLENLWLMSLMLQVINFQCLKGIRLQVFSVQYACLRNFVNVSCIVLAGDLGMKWTMMKNLLLMETTFLLWKDIWWLTRCQNSLNHTCEERESWYPSIYFIHLTNSFIWKEYVKCLFPKQIKKSCLTSSSAFCLLIAFWKLSQYKDIALPVHIFPLRI